MRENKFQDACLRWVKRCFHGELLAVNFHGDSATNKGFPDLIVFGDEKAVAFELKGDSGYTLQDDQIIWRNRFLNVGTPHHVVRDDLEEFKRIIREEFPNETEQEAPEAR